MSGREWGLVGGVLVVMFAMLPLVGGWVVRLGLSAEVGRKAVWVLAGLAVLPLVVMRFWVGFRERFGGALHGVKRVSYGELLFATAVAAVFHLAGGDGLVFGICIGILTLADAAGALAGTRWGMRRYGCGDGFKSVEGSVVFWLVAFFCVWVPLWVTGRVGVLEGVWIAIILGLLAMMAEGLSDRGFDNVVLPVGCFFVLERLLPLGVGELVVRFVVLGVLLVLVLWGSRWSTLSGAALLGSGLLGYGCAVIADWRFALPPLVVFLMHLRTTRKHGLVGRFDHRVDVVISHALGCLPWVVFFAMGWVDWRVGLAGVAFAMAVQLGLLDASTRLAVGLTGASYWRAILKGWGLAGFSGLVWLLPWDGREVMVVFAGVVGTWLALCFFVKTRERVLGNLTSLWMLKGVLSLAVSLLVLMMGRS